MSLQFLEVDPPDLKRWWGYVRSGLSVLMTKGEDSWWPEDVYREISEGRVTLVMALDGATPVGFVVANISRDAGGPYLWIWLIFAPGQLPQRQEFIAYLLAAADRRDCYKIEGGSVRAGWKPTLEAAGFKPSTIWTLTLKGAQP